MSSKQPKYEYVSTAKLPTRMGDFKIHGFVEASGQEHVALLWRVERRRCANSYPLNANRRFFI